MSTLNQRLEPLAKRGQALRQEAEAMRYLSRDLTATEERRVDEMHAEVKGLLNRTKAIKTEEKVMAAIRELGEDIGGAPNPGLKAGMSPKIKAAGGSTWGAAIINRHSDHYGLKALTVAGTIPVTVPLATAPVTKEAPVLLLRQLIPAVADEVGRWSYLRQTVRTNNAAVVAPGALKPQSLYTMARIENRARTLAHLSEPIPRQDLADAPLLGQFVDDEMRLGLELALETEIINGDGTGERFEGLATTSGIQLQAVVTNNVTTIRHAINKLEAIGLNATGILINPNDWLIVELAFANSYSGAPGVVGPIDRVARRIWGVPTAVSTAVPAGTAYVADFASSTQLHIREDAILDWSENTYDPNGISAGVGATDFQRNMMRFRCEGRFGLDVLRPLGIVKTTLGAT